MTDPSPETPAPPPAEPKAEKTPLLLRLGLDFGPLLIFFLTNAHAPVAKDERIFVATGVFMLALLVSILLSWRLTGRVSALQWFNGIVVLVFGSLTLILHDALFIKIKPTILYGLYALLLGASWLTHKPFLKTLLEDAFPPLDEAGWIAISRNWAFFFFVMAIANEAAWRLLSTDSWVSFKTWVAFPVSLVFGMLQAPLITKHLIEDDETEAGD